MPGAVVGWCPTRVPRATVVSRSDRDLNLERSDSKRIVDDAVLARWVGRLLFA